MLKLLFLTLCLAVCRATMPGKPCARTDTECLLSMTRRYLTETANNIPELDLEKLDPFTVDKLEYEVPQAKYTFTNFTATGFSDLRVSDFSLIGSVISFFVSSSFSTEASVSATYNLPGGSKTISGTVESPLSVKAQVAFDAVDKPESQSKIGKEIFTIYAFPGDSHYTLSDNFLAELNSNPEVREYLEQHKSEVQDVEKAVFTQFVNQLVSKLVKEIRQTLKGLPLPAISDE